MKLTAVVPCYNEEAALHYFYQEMQKVMQDMQDIEFEILFINDGSKDKTLEVIRELAKQDEKVKYVSFSRNFGKEAAIYAGLQYSDGDLTAIMDADLQDPPSLLPQMYRAITEEGYDSVAELLGSLTDDLLLLCGDFPVDGDNTSGKIVRSLIA